MSRLLFTTLLSIALLIAVVAYRYQNDNVWLAKPPKEEKAPENEPDFYLVNTKSLEYDVSGRLRFQMAAQRITHFPVGDYAQMEDPTATLFHKDGTPWYISAQQGQALIQLSTFELWDQVLVTRDTPKQPLKIETERLTLSAEPGIAQTQEPVLITSATSRAESIGMKAYVDEDRIELLKQVRVKHAPATKPVITQ